MSDWDDEDFDIDVKTITDKKGELGLEDEADKEPEVIVPKTQPAKPKPAYMQKPKASLPTFDHEELTPKEKEEIQMKSDMIAGMELCGVSQTGSELENLETIVEFREFAKKLGEPLTSRAKSKHYVDFITTLMTVAVHPLDAAQLRQVSSNIKALADSRTAEEKNKKKDSSKPSIKSNKSATQGAKAKQSAYGDDAVYDEYDDFM